MNVAHWEHVICVQGSVGRVRLDSAAVRTRSCRTIYRHVGWFWIVGADVCQMLIWRRMHSVVALEGTHLQVGSSHPQCNTVRIAITIRRV